MKTDSWFTGDDGIAEDPVGGSARPIPTTILFAVADVVLGGEPAQVTRKILTRLAKLIGRAPNGDEIRAVMTHLRAQASELAAIAGTPEDRGMLINAAATAGARVVEARAEVASSKGRPPEEQSRRVIALSEAIDAARVAAARLRAI